MEDKYSVWAVVAGDDSENTLASPHDDGTVSISVTTTWNRAKWKEFRSQVDQLFDIAEQKGKA